MPTSPSEGNANKDSVKPRASMRCTSKGGAVPSSLCRYPSPPPAPA